MTKKVLTVEEDMPIEEAARIMVDNKVGGLPVVKNGELVGLITETDLFKMLLELMGARDQGVRVTAVVPDTIGTLAKITQAIANADGSFLAFGEFSGEAASNRIVTFKVRRLDEKAVREVVEPVVDKIIDIRTN